MWLVRGACCALTLSALFAAGCVDLRINPTGRTRRYQVARLRNWLAAGLVYVIFYQARYAATISNTHETRELMGVSPAQYGSILTAGFWTYAVWTGLNGHVLDRVGGRRGMLIGCLGCATSCACIAVAMRLRVPPFWAIVLLNSLNMGLASLAALSVLRINVEWYTKAERGVFSGVFGVMVSVGYYLALTVGSWVEADLPRGFAFFMPAALLLLVGVPLCLFVIKDAPPTDMSPLEDADAPAITSAPPPLRFSEAAFSVLSHSRVRAAAVALLGVGWAQEGFLSWP